MQIIPEMPEEYHGTCSLGGASRCAKWLHSHGKDSSALYGAYRAGCGSPRADTTGSNQYAHTGPIKVVQAPASLQN
ncbi:unnamed protein product [Phytophthora lilii]|uniref:Unnamed protein product n=1 Tax=Phytophthora lilii TaxID=2077276 RepID=A0A9W6X1P1_9STRA|nr:unnamed protein product [Phytophthora lilii]